MANFRCERIYVMLDDPVPGLDHLKAIDPFEFAELDTDGIAELLDVDPLSRFLYAPFERPRWRPAAKGLTTVRRLREYYEGLTEAQRVSAAIHPELLEKTRRVLQQLEDVLDAADTRDRKFYLQARDLA